MATNGSATLFAKYQDMELDQLRKISVYVQVITGLENMGITLDSTK